MKRRSYLSSRESRSSLHHDSRNVRAIPRLKNIFSSDDLYSFFLSKNRKFAGRKWPRRGEKSVAFVGRRSIENIGATPSRFLEGLGLSGEG